MHQSFYINTPFATPEETAETLGVQPKRARTLIAKVRESLQKKSASRPPTRAPKSLAKSRSASRRKLTRAQAKRSH